MEKAKEEKAYSYNDVKNILCEACRLGVSEATASGIWYHRINGIQVSCLADDWRRKASLGSIE